MSELTPDVVLRAYACGLFPMAERRDDPTLHWVEPELRGIIPLDAFHVPRRLARRVKSGAFELRVDSDFASVIRACAEPTPRRKETWINDQIITLYCALHERGNAHSVECWTGGRLVGGLYGVRIAGAFFGESMFSHEADASKVALVHLVERLRRGGFRLLDAQFITPHLRAFGAVEVPRARYHALLRDALAADATFYPEEGEEGSEGSAASAQSSTQMS